MPETRYARLNREITEAITDGRKRDALFNCMKRGRDSRAEALAAWPGGTAFRSEARQVKEKCLDRQPELLERFIENAKKRGTKIFLAKDGAEAVKYVLDLAKARGAKSVAKAKSLTTEEIEINVPLIQAGLEVVETDLGELIIQLAGEKPYHLVFPAVHKTTQEIAKIFADATGKSVDENIPSIMPVVREYLRSVFLNADIGMTGANVGIAETGGIVIETNEGNGRLVSSIGDCHVCVMGSEKIVDTLEEAMLMVLAHPISATGQCPTTYVTWMHGRSPMGEGDGQARESHIVILDNGRTEMAKDPAMREALYCIRCGACMNICPTYGVVGGHTFGYIYPGPIGIPWTAQVHGLEKAGDFAPLCLSCGLCQEICPVGIDLPMLIAEVKDRDSVNQGRLVVDKVMMAADTMATLGSATAPFSNWFLKSPLFRLLLEKVSGLDRRRPLPPFSPMYVTKRFRDTMAQQAALPIHKVAFFADVYAHYNEPGLGTKVVEHLQGCGCQVKYPQQKSSGYPYIAYGDLDKARERARYNVDRFAPMVRDGYNVVSPEPTAVYALRECYPKLLDGDADAVLVAEKTYGLFEYLLEVEVQPDRTLLEGRRFGFHCPCHQRRLEGGTAAVTWLQARGTNVEIIETGTCCGMGGTFGFKAGPLGHDLSQAIGEPLFKLFKESGVETIVTESSVCKIQLEQGTGLPVYHPIEVVLPG